MKEPNRLFRWLFYLLGLLILAVGLTLNTKTGQGVTPIVSVPYCISQLSGLNFGNMTLLIYCLFVAAQFLIKGKKARWTDLLQVPLSIVFTRFMNLFDQLLDFEPQGAAATLLLLAAAILCTGVGAAMSVNMNLVPNPGDGIVAALAQRTGREMGLVKNCFDLLNVCLTLAMGFAFAQPFCGIGLGTLLAMVGVGRVIALFNRFCRLPLGRLAGLEAAAA